MSCEVFQSDTSVEVRDGDRYGIKDARIIDVLEITDAPGSDRVGVRASCPQKINSTTGVHLLFAHNMGNNEEKLEALI